MVITSLFGPFAFVFGLECLVFLISVVLKWPYLWSFCFFVEFLTWWCLITVFFWWFGWLDIFCWPDICGFACWWSRKNEDTLVWLVFCWIIVLMGDFDFFGSFLGDLPVWDLNLLDFLLAVNFVLFCGWWLLFCERDIWLGFDWPLMFSRPRFLRSELTGLLFCLFRFVLSIRFGLRFW